MYFIIPENKSLSVEFLKSEENIEFYSVKAEACKGKLHFEWAEPMEGHYGVWHPMCGRNRQMPQWFCTQKTESCFYKGAPVIATFSSDGRNIICVSLKDTFNPAVLGFYVDDFNEKYEVIFTVEIDVPSEEYSTVLRIDRSPVPLADAVHGTALWWNGDIKRHVPDDAFFPLYSSWYNFHQTPEQKQLTEELKTASELGFRTFILDDGWQIRGSGTKDYLLSGDWKVASDKFPDFRKFVDDVHSFGMKFMLWFAVPFVGFETKAYARFKDKLLFEQKGFINAGILDIRYPDVRRFISDTYAGFAEEYGIDGLKLDFIDNFRCYENTPGYKEGMDCDTVEKAVVVLLTEIRNSVCRLKPDFLFEYRQYYVGPSILEFGSMIRVADCAFDSLTNRIGVADLRMMTDSVAVHSDMLLWSPSETPENCRMQLLDVMFSAVQISVLLRKSSPEQIQTLKSFLKYATENREVLLKGRFRTEHPELNYTLLSSEITEKNRKIAVLYACEPYEYCGMNEDVWNASSAEKLVVINKKHAEISISVSDFYGNIAESFITSEENILVRVPSAGMMKIKMC